MFLFRSQGGDPHQPSFRARRAWWGVPEERRRRRSEISSEDARQLVCGAGREIWEKLKVGDLRTRGTGADGRRSRPHLLQGGAPASTASERASAALGRRSAGLHIYDKSCKQFRSEQIEEPERTLADLRLIHGKECCPHRACGVAPSGVTPSGVAPCGAVAPQFSRVQRGTAAGAGARLAHKEGKGGELRRHRAERSESESARSATSKTTRRRACSAGGGVVVTPPAAPSGAKRERVRAQRDVQDHTSPSA